MQGRAELYTYESDTMLYALGWSVRQDRPFRLAVGSFLDSVSNHVELLQLNAADDKLQSNRKDTFDHPYPPTKIMFHPEQETSGPDLVATSGDMLRLFRITEDAGVKIDRCLENNQSAEYCAPLTSFDWSELDPTLIGTCSIDTTCSIWDVEKATIVTQLIAHDREVNDIAWGGPGVFGSVSADGSVRVFDLRDKDHSTIVYELPEPDTPLLRLAWNRIDSRYMAATVMDSPRVIVLDVRFPTAPVFELTRHTGPANAVVWAPHTAQHLCTAADDGQALIWDLKSNATVTSAGRARDLDPVLAYQATEPINQLQWSSAQTEWVAICFGKSVQTLRV